MPTKDDAKPANAKRERCPDCGEVEGICAHMETAARKAADKKG